MVHESEYSFGQSSDAGSAPTLLSNNKFEGSATGQRRRRQHRLMSGQFKLVHQGGYGHLCNSLTNRSRVFVGMVVVGEQTLQENEFIFEIRLDSLKTALPELVAVNGIEPLTYGL